MCFVPLWQDPGVTPAFKLGLKNNKAMQKKEDFTSPLAGGRVKEGNCWSRVGSLGREDPLEEEMATHSSILAWEILWTEEPGGLHSMGSQELDTT